MFNILIHILLLEVYMLVMAAHCLALPKAQSSHGLNVTMIWIRALAVAWVMDLEGCPSSTCKWLMFFLHGAVSDCALSLCVSWRNLTPVTQPLWGSIQQSRMILPFIELNTMLFLWSLEILFPCKCLHFRENRFAPALQQNFMGHRVHTHSVSSTC